MSGSVKDLDAKMTASIEKRKTDTAMLERIDKTLNGGDRPEDGVLFQFALVKNNLVVITESLRAFNDTMVHNFAAASAATTAAATAAASASAAATAASNSASALVISKDEAERNRLAAAKEAEKIGNKVADRIISAVIYSVVGAIAVAIMWAIWYGVIFASKGVHP